MKKKNQQQQKNPKQNKTKQNAFCPLNLRNEPKQVRYVCLLSHIKNLRIGITIMLALSIQMHFAPLTLEIYGNIVIQNYIIHKVQKKKFDLSVYRGKRQFAIYWR